jgi:hypothetical protein
LAVSEPSFLPASGLSDGPCCVDSQAQRPGGHVQDHGHIGQGAEKIKSARDR